MDLTFAVYNVKWMKDLFYRDGTPKSTDAGDQDDRDDAERGRRLASVVRTIDPDILCITEGPDTLKDQTKTASQQLLAWRDLHDMDPDYDAVHGFPSGGQQELCALFKKTKVSLTHDPERNAKKHPFDQPFLVDTLESLIKEQYSHYRPPLELSVREPGHGGDEVGRIIVAHAKSKGIFDSVDLARFEQLSERNRRKLFAECYSIRERCTQWLSEDPTRKIIVCGDINDGFGLDYYESRFGKSAVEVLMGEVWEPQQILRHVLPRPKLNKWGWVPSSSRFRDRITEDQFNVLIDHILVSQAVGYHNGLVWNPFPDKAPDFVKAIKQDLLAASDHFPVSVEVVF